MLKFRLLLLLPFLALLGCRTNPACERQVGLMRAELIALEDRYYELESKYRAAVGDDHVTIEHYEGDGAPAEYLPPPADAKPASPTDPNTRIQIDPNDSSRSEPNRASPIANSISPDPELSVVTFQTPARFAAAAGNHQNPASHPNSESTAQSADRAPLIVDPFNLRGRDDDGQPGDEGISFSIEMPEGWLDGQGELSVAVIDPKESSERQRIGLWQFSADELVAQPSITNATNPTTIPLSLDWNLHAPRHGDLLLFVRWQAADQAPLERSQSFVVNPVAGAADLPRGSESQASPMLRTADQDASNAPEWQPER